MSILLTPADVEERLSALSGFIDEAHAKLVDAEREYHLAKADFEIAFAHAVLTSEGKSEDRRKAMAVQATTRERRRLAIAEAVVRSQRANATRLETQASIAQSQGVLVRAALGIA